MKEIIDDNKLNKEENKLFIWIAIFIIFTTMFVFVSEIACGLIINEIMFNPEGSDTGREWIEIYDNASCYDLSQYKLFQSSNHYIYPYNNITSCNYSIICSNCELFLAGYGLELNQTTPIYKSSFTLSNSGELIALKLNESVIDEINYSVFINISEGYSLEYYNKSWRQSINISGTPGLASLIASILENDTSFNNTSNNSNETSDITTNINANITTNVTVNYTTNTSINITTNITTNTSSNIAFNTTNYCNISINITLKNSSIEVFNNKESLKFYNKIYDNNYDNIYNEPYTYSIDYWIEDLFGNIMKSKTTTTNQNEKSYTPSIYEKDRIFIIKNTLHISGCVNIGKTESSKIILIKNQNYNEENSETVDCPVCTTTNDATSKNSNSTINISKLTSEKGKIISELYIYKGDTRKSVMMISILDEKEKTIEEQKIKLNDKYSSVVVNFERKIECYEDKTLFLVAEGLDAYIKEKIILNCDSKTSSSATEIAANSASISAKNENAIVKNPAEASQLTGQVIYESPNQKNKIYSFIGLVLLCLAGISFLGYKIYGLFRKMHKITDDENNNVDKNEKYEKTPI